MRKPDFCLCENKGADQLRGNREADHAFVFATWIVHNLASSFRLSLYRPICVGPGRKPRRPVFSSHGSIEMIYYNSPNLTSEGWKARGVHQKVVLCI